VTSSPSSGETAASAAAVTIELTWLDCGRPIADIVAPASPAEVATMLLRLPWRRLRCGTCGGAAVVSELVPNRRQELPLDWASHKPRCGRPSKRIVELE
jgi:hypothetical protein